MRVLIADKIPSMRSALKFLLSQFKEIDGIAEAKSEASLVDKIIIESPDIVLIDYDFLGSKTHDAIIFIKAKYPNISIVVLGISSKIKNKYLKLGIDEYIMKGYPPERLFNVLRYLVNKKNMDYKNIEDMFNSKNGI